jgi:hypothetical protein
VITMRRIALILAVLSLSLLLLAGCSDNKAQNEAASTPAAETQAAHAPAPAAVPADAFLGGKVLETMNSGGYSYVKIDSDKGEVWVAGPETAGITIGQTVSIPDGMMMANFNAKSLDRIFESIYFTGAINVAGAGSGSGAHGMPAMGGMPGGQTASGTSTVLDKAEVKDVAKAEGGYTVADIYAQAAGLSGQSVKLRGQVVKFTPNIMGTNWAHIQDGTGDDKTSDLTVTTSATLNVGDLVVLEGVLAVDKDFGAGYKYHVIVEGATVTKD